MAIELSDLAGNIDVAIITMKDEERDAAEQTLGPLLYVQGTDGFPGIKLGMACTETNGAGTIFTLSQTDGQGPGPAQFHVRLLFERFHPRWIILCGICGVFPKEPKVTLGDVVIATRVYGPYLTTDAPDREYKTSDSGGPLSTQAITLANQCRELLRLPQNHLHIPDDIRRPRVNLISPNYSDTTLNGWNESILANLRTNFSKKTARTDQRYSAIRVFPILFSVRIREQQRSS